MSSAAVLAVYAAGYVRTRSAADRFEGQSERRRPPLPLTPAPVNASVTQVRTDAPAVAAPEIAAGEMAKSKTDPTALASPKPIAAAKAAVDAESLPPVTPAPASAPIPTVAAPAQIATVAEPAPPSPPPPPAPPSWKDGTYTGWGSSRHGDIQASVVVEGGRIASATIAQCRTRYSCSVIEALPPEVAQRQSAEVDSVSGATQSSDAFYYAVTDALSKAK